MDILPNWLAITVVSIFGLALGSFASAISWRLPRNISMYNNKKKQNSNRSFCPNCNKKLEIIDLIPLYSWLSKAGKCRYCLKKISIRYPLIEISTALLLVLFYIALPEIKYSWIELILFASLSTILITMATIDFEHKILPNSLNLLLAVLGILYIIIKSPPYDLTILPINIFLYAGVAFFIKWIFFIFTKKNALGMGDIKFFAAISIWLNIEQLPIFMMFAGIIGIIVGLIWKKITRENVFPFGPALILSFIINIIIDYNIFYNFLTI